MPELIENLKKNIFKAKTFLYLAIFFLPLERILVIDIADTKVRFTHLFLLIAMLIWILNKLTNLEKTRKTVKEELKEFSKNHFELSNLYRLIIFYFAILILSFLFGSVTGRSFQVLIYTLFILSTIFFIPHFFHKLNEIEIKEVVKAIKVFLAAALATCIFGIFQFSADMLGASTSWTFLTKNYTKSVLGFTRVQGFFMEPLYFANFLIFPIIFCILLLLQGVKKTSSKVFLWSTLGLSIVNFILTNARGAFISLFLVLIALLIFNRQKISKEFIFSCVAALILLTVVLGSVYFIMPQSKVGQFIIHATYPFQGAAYDERRETFGYAWQMFKEHKILGNGPGSFGEQAPLKAWEVRQNWKIVNNIYLELLAETGILGFGAMVLFFILLLWFLYKSYRKTADKLFKILFQGFFLVILGILIQYNTFSVIYLPYVWITIGLAMATLKLK